jgi:hypothetical protein
VAAHLAHLGTKQGSHPRVAGLPEPWFDLWSFDAPRAAPLPDVSSEVLLSLQGTQWFFCWSSPKFTTGFFFLKRGGKRFASIH